MEAEVTHLREEFVLILVNVLLTVFFMGTSILHAAFGGV